MQQSSSTPGDGSRVPPCLTEIDTFRNYLDVGNFAMPKIITQESMDVCKVRKSQSLSSSKFRACTHECVVFLFQVSHIGTSVQIGKGSIERQSVLPPDQIFFHQDGGPRIVQVSHNDVR